MSLSKTQLEKEILNALKMESKLLQDPCNTKTPLKDLIKFVKKLFREED